MRDPGASLREAQRDAHSLQTTEFNDRTDLSKLLRLCEVMCKKDPTEVRRLLNELTIRVEKTGDGLLLTKLLLLKTQAELELGGLDAARTHLQAGILSLNSCESVVGLEHELLSKIDQRQFSNYSDWESFRFSFEHQHPDFLLSLASTCPSLTPLELKICAMVRASLSTKEIMDLLQTSERNVENHRYRIRRKLDLRPHQNLNSFLLCI